MTQDAVLQALFHIDQGWYITYMHYTMSTALTEHWLLSVLMQNYTLWQRSICRKIVVYTGI